MLLNRPDAGDCGLLAAGSADWTAGWLHGGTYSPTAASRYSSPVPHWDVLTAAYTVDRWVSTWAAGTAGWTEAKSTYSPTVARWNVSIAGPKASRS